ncbi:putative Zein-binding domain-containing protein [Rosa chinensis]|uniref:Putative Zein-binding domain-containing protein n=1 Tax=Rosa chinensis TaxID=74649 RepID=A0A2P6PVJ0_ROSCH|nr:myosin-binding protein 3 isoform X2 [Rosa chinensis]PRQ25939.1 putative Zein-binding domain-containing protein [Rosa chinensis]
MAAKGKSSVQVQRNFKRFIAILTSAACEWFLIFLLFVDALLSYLLTKFAVYCDLQKPCILCSRFEHITGNESSQLYEDLLCSNHISKLTSWIASQIYGKDDGNGMHEDYLFPFTTRDNSNREMHMFSVGNSVSDVESYGSRRSMPSRSCVHSPVHSSVGVGQWSCCCSLWGHRGKFKGLKLKSSGTKHAKPNIPLPRLPNSSRSNRSRDSSKKIRDKSPASVTSCRSAKVGVDPLFHVGYSELKFFSDTDSEFLFSDGDDGSGLTSVTHEPKMEGLVRASRYRPKAPPNGLRSGRPSKRPPKPKRSLSEPWPVFRKAYDVKSLGSYNEFETGLSELNCQQSNRKSNPSALPELISLDDILSSPNVLEKDINGTGDFGYASINKNVELLKSVYATDGVPVKNDPALIKRNHSKVDAVSESEVGVRERDSSGTTTEAPLMKPNPGNVNAVSKSQGSVRERDSSGVTTEAFIKPDHNKVNAVSQSEGNVKERASSSITTETLIQPEHGKVNPLSQSDRNVKERDSSGVSKEQPAVKEPDRVDEEMEVLASQDSSARETNLSAKNTSSTVDGCVGEKQTTDASSSNAKPMLHTSASVESGLESLDGGYVSEIEGESIVDQLKRQIDYDRKCIKELYKELEEERSAAAIAANQAMAMITKLQEEKAAFHMEALHCLRMMEEQAEFDVEALEKANDLLAEKEKEIQDLEAELEFSKLDYQDESIMENPLDKSCDLMGGIDPVENTVMPGVKNDLNVTCNSMATEVSIGSNQPPFSETTLLEFEDEKLYITNCLKSLERKLSELSSRGASSKMLNGGHSQKHMDDGQNQAETPRKERSLLNDGQNQEETPRKGRSLLNGQLEENVLHGQKDLHMSNGSSAAQEGPTGCGGGDELECEDNNADSRGEKDIMDPGEMDLVILENEISDLNDRLEALETDHDFLEHMLYSLQNGAEGLQFVREIAHQLQELRKIGTGFR